jgi:hypothetical protein
MKFPKNSSPKKLNLKEIWTVFRILDAPLSKIPSSSLGTVKHILFPKNKNPSVIDIADIVIGSAKAGVSEFQAFINGLTHE